MSIKFNWIRKGDVEPLTKIRIEHVLSRDQLAALLLCAETERAELGTEISLPVTEAAIRRQLTWNREAADCWRDHSGFNTDDEAVLWNWAQLQVAKFGGEK